MSKEGRYLLCSKKYGQPLFAGAWVAPGKDKAEKAGRGRQPAQRSAEQFAARQVRLRLHGAHGRAPQAGHGRRPAVPPGRAPGRRGRALQLRERLPPLPSAASGRRRGDSSGGRAGDSGVAGRRGAELPRV
jgi:hypothetical protein